MNRWFNKLLPLVKPHLYVSGGPILMVQVENEYGYFACDHTYMDYLAKFLEDHLGKETLLFTTDSNSEGALRCGTTKRAFATVDFGTKDSKWNIKLAVGRDLFNICWVL